MRGGGGGSCIARERSELGRLPDSAGPGRAVRVFAAGAPFVSSPGGGAGRLRPGGRGGRSVLRHLTSAALLLLAALVPAAFAVPAVAQTAPAHCDPSDNRELWCGTMTVGVSSAKGGYSRSEGLGAIAPGSFTWRGATVNVTELSRDLPNLPIVDNSATTLQFSLEVASGAVPSGGILGSPDFLLKVRIGDHIRLGLGIENPGTKTSFSLPVEARDVAYVGDTLHWHPEGVKVQVQLVRQAAFVTNESIIVSDPGSDRTYGVGDTITVRLKMSESVFVTGRPHIWLNVGGVRRTAVYSGPVGTPAMGLDFSYAVQAGDSDTDGVALVSPGYRNNGIQLNGGSIQTVADETDAILRFYDLGPQSGHKVDAAEAFLPSTENCKNEVRVPLGWALTPSGLNVGDKFRLLFVTSTKRDAIGEDLYDYNEFVQNRAGWHSAIRPFKNGFQAAVSRGPGYIGFSIINARDNTCSTGTGVPIHWLGGNKVADSYADFYDGSWDDRTNWRDESGNALSPGKVWTGSNDNGTAHSSRHMGASMVAGTDGASSSAKPLTGADGSKSEQRHLYGLSQVFKVATSTEGPSTSSIELTGSRASDDIFGLGERVEITVTFSEPVTVRGTPSLGLSIQNADGIEGEYEAAFVSVRRSGGLGYTKLVFGFVVPSGLHDTDGIEVDSTALRLNGGEILARLDGLPAHWTIAARKNLGGTVNSLLVRTGGVCDRTPPVRYAIVAALSESGVKLCSQVTAAHLAGMTTLSVEGLTSIAVGDFAGLSGLQSLTSDGSGIETLPVGLFDGLDSLEALFIQMGLTHLPKDIFRGLGKVWWLRMEGLPAARQPRNYLRTGGLPDGIFEPLADVTERIRQGRRKLTQIFGNPGYPAFWRGGVFVAPALSPRAADAGPGGTLSAGQTVTLGGPGNDGGLWGSNVTYLWWQRASAGAAASIVTLSNELDFGRDNQDLVPTDVPNPSFTVPALAEETEVRLSLRLNGGKGDGAKYDGSVIGEAAELLGLWSPPSEARFTIRALAPTDVAVASTPVSGTAYRRGEAIEVAVTFGDRVLVTSQGTPSLALTVGTEVRQASYVRGTGTTQLVFAYMVVAADSDTDGIAVAADALALNGGAITSVYGTPALLDHDAVDAQSGHGVDGSQTPGFSLADGVCARTGQVRDKLVDLVNDVPTNSAVTNCSLVTEAHLAALTGTLDLASAGIAALKAGDFAGLDGIATLTLDSNALTALPARVFESLTALATLTLAGNPGAAGFAPVARAGPAGGFDAVSGGSVTLGVEAAAGQDDPWGSNVTYVWSRPAGTGGALTAETAARAGFAAPAPAEDETHTIRLTVTGRGAATRGVANRHSASADVVVRVAAGPKVERVSFATLALSDGGPAYTADGVVSVTLGFDRAVTVATAGGTPSVSLTVGTATKTADYLSGTGTRSLTFGYTVVAADTDTDGVDVAADSLALNGGRITGVSDGGAAALGHAGLVGGSDRPVNGSGAPVVSGGICGRTAAVQAAILARVRTAEDDATLACGAITPAMLTAIAGRLDMSAQVAAHGRMTALKVGDFAWLANVMVLDLDRHALRSFPVGVFDGLSVLRELSVAYNQTQAADRMTTLPAGLFDRLTKLTTLRLEHNDLETLPDGIFERLTRLTTLTLDGNPGSASFLPVAVAGPASGLDAEAGDLVTLGGAPGGPWGGNLVHAWRQVAGPTEALSASNVAAPSFTAPALGRAVALEYELTVTGGKTTVTGTDRVTVRVAPSAVVASLAAVSGPVSGDTYRWGETLGVAVTFGKPVVVTGTPQLALSVGAATRQAAYVRGTGTNQLVFEYTVFEADRDPNGIAVAANALALNNGTIADAGGAAADLDHDALMAQSGHRVDGSLAGLTGGICGRTPEVRDTLLVRVRTVNAGLSCDQVTATHLGALTGALSLSRQGIRALRPGDFAGLANVTALDLGGNDLVSLLAGLFGPLTGLTALDLSDNDLAALPPRLFEQLTGLTALTLSGNPGSARFRPIARAGPEGGIEVAQGATVTLGVAGAEDGFDDPWGSNVAWAWARTAGPTVSYASDKGADTVRPEFAAPGADGTLTFTLTVTGKGGITATDTVSVRVGAAGVRPMPKSAAVNGATLTLIYDEVLQTASLASAAGKGPVYLAVVSAPGALRSIETARPMAAKASGRTVTMTLDPPAASNETVTLSYYPDNATADSRVRDTGGNLANGFAGFQVRNVTAEGPGVLSVAFAGAGKTYGIGDTIGIDVTFSEAVTVTGRPTLALEVGAATRKAGWKAGQGAGAVQRFEFTVAAGDADSDGVTVKANGLEAPSGSSIVTVAKGGAVGLRHASHRDPAHKVDGVLPMATAASPAHCDASDTTELWCAVLTVGSSPTNFRGFNVFDDYGALEPDHFIYRGESVSVLRFNEGTATQGPRLDFVISVPADTPEGLLGPVSYVLEIGTGAGKKSFAIDNPGDDLSFNFRNHGFTWSVGDLVPVRLVRAAPRATAASVTSSPASRTTYGAGETVTVRLTMSEAVRVTGRPHVWLDVGAGRHQAVYIGAIGTSTTNLDFSYVVQADDFTANGVGLCAPGGAGCGSIHLNGGTIRAAFDETDAQLVHSALGAQSRHKVDGTPLIIALPTGCAGASNEMRVPSDWALKPSEVSVGGKFRLLFVTLLERTATSSNIADYNSFVQVQAAAGGHADILPFSGGFRAVGSTSSVHARDNTCTTARPGVPIYWLNGSRVANGYLDFYDTTWDDQTHPTYQSGNRRAATDVWTGSSPFGTKIIASLGAELVEAGYIGNAGEGPLFSDNQVQNDEINPLYGLSQVFKVLAVNEGLRTTGIKIVQGLRPAPGDTFRVGEIIRLEVAISERVVVHGTPFIGLSIRKADGTEGEYEAAYVGNNLPEDEYLVFEFVVPPGLKDDDGIKVHSTALRLKGARIVVPSDGYPVSWAIEAEHNILNAGGTSAKVDSSQPQPLTGGVCDRTPAVRYAIVAALSSKVELCSQVTAAHLAGMTALRVEGLTSLAVGDFDGLSGLQYLTSYGSGIETLPVGLFDGLDSLEWLNIQMGLTHMPKDIFRGLGKVWSLRMEGLPIPGQPRNYLRAGGLPDGIFEPFADVTERIRQGRGKRTQIFGNPGYPAFRRGGAFVAPALSPRAADAGPGGTLSAGQTVTLGGPGNDGGLWGSNVTYLWQQRDGAGVAASIVTLSNLIYLPMVTDVPNPSFTVPALAEETEVRLSLQLDGGKGNGASYDGSETGVAEESLVLWSPPSEARFTIRALAPTDVAVVSTPVLGTSYRRGEAIEVAVTFGDRVLVDTSQGTPSLALTVGTEAGQASYVRGTGTTQLVFAYTVVAADSDTDGIAVAADALALNGGAITSVYGVAAFLDHDAVDAQSGHGVDGSQTPGFSLADGVCGRTGQVRDKLVDLVNDALANSAVTNCSLVTEAHLAALAGTLDLASAGIAALKTGDFAGLDGIATLNLDSNALMALPARVFEPLTALATLTLGGNPGAAGFAPQAVAGPAGGFDAVSGGSVTLGVEGAAAGQDDPWGSNVTYVWSRLAGTGGALTAATAARAVFAAPAEDETHTIRLTVTGRGAATSGEANRHSASADVAVRVAAGPKVERVSFATLSLSAGGPAYTADGVVSVTLGFDRAVTVATAGGTPSVSLTVGTATKTADYLSGTGTRSLTFGYTVVAADTDTDGVDVAADSLALNGGRITGVSDGGAAALGHAGLVGGSDRPVNGSGAPVVSGGICGRTAAVQAAILARVRTAEDDAVLACGAVTPAMLTAIAGRLDVSAQVVAHGRMTALKAGDFAWLANVTALDLDQHALRLFPGGVFDGLSVLRELSVAYNQTQAADRMTTLPAGLFDRLTTLTTLRLEHNDLETLPDGIFERLTRLTTLTLNGNPGSASFLPVAVAGPAGGFDAAAGDLVTLGGAPGGPWGGNLVHAWRQVAGPTEALSAPNVAAPIFTAPALERAVALEYELTATGRGTRRTATDRVTVRVAPSAVVASLAAVSGPVSGDTYRLGETLGVAVTFGKPVVVTGTPQLALSVGAATRQAAYVRGTGTSQLVFEYTVVEADRDPDGIAVAANALALNNGTIADAGGEAADLDHGALTAQSGHRVDGSLAGLTGGICGRTPEVRDTLLVRARTVNTGLSCDQVTATHLGALTGALSLSHRGIRALRPGDFAGLANVTALDLGGNDLVSLLAGLFGPLTGLTALDLSDNDLAALPVRLFEQLTGLTALTLSGNPGSARFRPVAKAGPEGGIEVAQGATVTLGVAGAEDGFDDPWGSNVAWAWTQTAGPTVSYASDKGADTVRPEFAAPSADGTLTFTLTVTGKGGITATDTVSVRIGAAGMRPMPKSAAVNGATLTLIYDEVLQTASLASSAGKGPVYLAVVSAPGAQRSIETARPTAAKASGRTVTMTLDPPAAANETITLSYYPDNATADSRVRDTGGNLANGFAGLQVRNDTPGPHVDDIAFAGAAQTYAIGGRVAVEVTFTQAVAVTTTPTARPELSLTVGANTRKALYVSGTGSATLRFEYAIVAGDEDGDGVAIPADALSTPSGSSIVTVAGSRTVQFGHDAVAADPAHKVDGVLQTADPASAAVLVSNFGESASSSSVGFDSGGQNDLAQVFTTGTNAAGYTLTSVEMAFYSVISAADIGDLSVSVWSVDSSGNPLTKQFDLTKPASIDGATISGADALTGNYAVFTAPSNTTLTQTTAYAVVLTYDQHSILYSTVISRETSTASGWSIAAESLEKPSAGSSWRRRHTILIRVNGEAKANTAPTSADKTVVTPEDTDYTFLTADFPFTDTDMGDTLSSVKIVTLPTSGTLTLSGTALTSGDLPQTVLYTDLADGNLKYVPPANESGAALASFIFRVNDGTADSVATKTMTVNVTAVPDVLPVQPGITAAVLVSNLGESATGSGAGFGPGGSRDLAQVFTTGSNAAGYTLTSIEVPFSFAISAANIGDLSVSVWSVDGSGNPQTKQFDLTKPASIALPTSTSTGLGPATVSTLTGNYTVFTAPSNKTLTMMTDYAVVLTRDYQGGLWTTLSDTETSAASGWSIANGGLVKPSAGSWSAIQTILLRVNGEAKANTAPTSVGEPFVIATEETEYTFSSADFPFSDTDGDTLSSVKIVSLPARGTLTLSGTAIPSGDLPKTVAAAQIGTLKYIPLANDSGAALARSFTFRVNDGTDDSAATSTMAVYVQAVNDAPTGQPGITGTAQVGEVLTATVGDIADVDGLPDPFFANATTSIRWIRVDGGDETDILGAVYSSYVLVAADEGKTIKVKVVRFDDRDQFANGPLTSDAYPSSGTVRPAAPGQPVITGTALVSNFGESATATVAVFGPNGESDLAQGFMTGTNAVGYTLTSVEMAAREPISAADIGDLSVSVWSVDSSGNPQTKEFDLTNPASIDIATLSGSNVVTGNSAVFTAPNNTTLTQTTNYAVVLTYDQHGSFWASPSDDPETSAASGWSIPDHGGRSKPSAGSSWAGRTTFLIRFNGEAKVNTAPTAQGKTMIVTEDTDYTFLTADFPFTDTDGDSLSSVKIVTLPTAGTFTLSGTALTSGDLPQTVTAADLAAGNLKYVPPANESGNSVASFTFRVNDGTDDSAATYTRTAHVQAVNDAPTGQPGITGTAQVGEVLTATVGDIADVDGLPDPFFSSATTTIRWIRVDGGDETDIPGAVNSGYTLVAADEGKTIKVKVARFGDRDGFTNGPLTSDAYPSSGTVLPAAPGQPVITGTALVSNFGEVATTTGAVFGPNGESDLAQVFTTGTHAAGYTLTSVEMAAQEPISAADIGDLSVSVWSVDSSGNPQTKEFDLTNPASIDIATLSDANVVTGNSAVFTAPNNTTLTQTTNYAVVLTYDQHGSLWASDQDFPISAASGWSIPDRGREKPSAGSSWTENKPFLIRVNGEAKANTAPTSVRRSVADGRGHGLHLLQRRLRLHGYGYGRHAFEREDRIAAGKGHAHALGHGAYVGGPAADGARGRARRRQPEIRPPGEQQPCGFIHLQGERRHGRQCGDVCGVPRYNGGERRGDGPAGDHGHGAGGRGADGDGGRHCGCGQVAGPLLCEWHHHRPVAPG